MSSAAQPPANPAGRAAGGGRARPARPGRLIVVSGPSGSGKSTLVARLFEVCPLELAASVSATTRAPRPGEIPGRHYHFLSREEFNRLRQQGEFLECCEVHHNGDWYGTLRSEVVPRLAEGKSVVLEIDVQGTLAVLQHYPDAVTFFVRLESMEELERRLRLRGTEGEAAIQRRLDSARREMAQADCYRYQILNDDVDRAVGEMCALLTASGGSPK